MSERRLPNRTIDLLEHAEHVLQVGVVQEPYGGVPVILLIRHWNHTQE